MKTLKGNNLIVLAVLLSVTITATYGYSMTLLYGGIELLLAGFCYLLVLLRWRKTDPYLLLIFVILTGFSFINGLVNQDLKSVVLMSISLILPLAVSVILQNEGTDVKSYKFALLATVTILIIQETTLFLGHLNSNTYGFMSYYCVAAGLAWYLDSKRRLFPAIALFIGFAFAVWSGSRNVAIVSGITVLLILIPSKWYRNIIFYRTLYILILLYTLMAAAIIEWGFSQERIAQFLIEYTEKYSDKAWSMLGRVSFSRMITETIAKLAPFEKLFGLGIFRYHSHNLFYQSVLVYGYVGAVLIYAFLVRILEMAYALISNYNDKIALGCVIAILGCLLLNGADMFLFGTETCAVMPQVFMGVIVYRYRQKLHCRQTV